MNNLQNDITHFHNLIKRPLVLDGAVGSLLQQRNIKMDEKLWSSYANIVAPVEVVRIHKEYIDAGADIITTNTFRTNPNAYNSSSLNISNKEFVKTSVDLAISSMEKSSRKIFIAGSNPPAEDSYQSFRKISSNAIELNHKNHIDFLWESGVDFVLNETQSHFDEIKIICEHCRSNKIPFLLSLFVTIDSKILSGESLINTLKFISDYNPIAVGINCISPKVFEEIIDSVELEMEWGFYLNCGSGLLNDREIFEGVTPSNYIDILKRNFNREPFFIGSCCGSSPSHTKAIKEFLIGKH